MSKDKQVKWFKSNRVDFSNSGNIDAENGIIHGVIMCQVGPAKGHGVHLEQEFINDGIAYAQKHHSKKGMKARFGHPSMSNETLGTEMGKFREFRVEGDKMIADLHLFKSANLSPTNPGMRDWMLSMADEDPEMVMSSIVFKPIYEYQYDDDDKRVNIWFYDKKGNCTRCRNKNGEVSSYNPNEKLFVQLEEFYFCDIVDQGAATDKLFSEQFNQDKFGVVATQFLNDNPNIDSFIQENPDKILEFISKRFETEPNQESSFIDSLKSLFSLNKSNQNQFYMSKIQLSKLSELSEKLKNKEAGTADYAAVQTELQEQGVDVVVLGSANHGTQTARALAMAASHKEAVLVLSPDTKEEDIPKTSLSELIKTTLAEKDKEIADLQTKLDDKGDTPPSTPKSDEQQNFGDDNGKKLSPAEKEKENLAAIVKGANSL